MPIWLCSSKLISRRSDILIQNCVILKHFRLALFPYASLDCTPFSISVSCHTCYYFIISVTIKKYALLFCIPYTAQMHWPLAAARRNFQKFNSFWNIHNKSADFKDCFENKKILFNEKNYTFTIYYKNLGIWNLVQKDSKINQHCVES